MPPCPREGLRPPEPERRDNSMTLFRPSKRTPGVTAAMRPGKEIIMTARKAPPSRALTARPDLDQLRRQAKELLTAFHAGDDDAVAEVRVRYRDADRERFALHDAQLVLARSYGFDSWPKLKAYVDGATVRRLVEAVRADDFAAVDSLIDARPELANMEVSGDDEHRAIHHAVLVRSPEMVRLLMRRGADARCGIYPHRDATTAILIASERGYDEIVAIIREEEAKHSKPQNVEACAIDRPAGPLTAAVTAGRADLLAELLAKGLDPNEPTRLEHVDGAVLSAGHPLHYCATHGKLAMAEMLLEAGADPNLQVYTAGSSVFRAYMSGNAKMIALLERHGGVVDGVTVGVLGLEEKTRQLLDAEESGTLDPRAYGGPVGPESRIANDLLWGAAGAGHPEIVRICLARMDQPRDAWHWYNVLREPMYIGMRRKKAERHAMLECFRLILERADPSVHGDRSQGWVGGRTLLHDLSGSRHDMPPEDRVAIATMLLDAGARLDIRDDLLQSTPLGWACRWGRVELVRLLLDRGADPVEADAEPWATPRAWARKRGHARITPLLDKADH
jgi:ankyrin repeat protein